MSDVVKHNPSNLTSNKPKRDAGSDIDAFVRRTRALQVANRAQMQRGRVMLALDATYSRQATWDMAMHVQGEMGEEVSNLLDVKLVFYRGLAECKATGWVSSSPRLANSMSGITCAAGRTQIGKVLALARDQAAKCKTLVFVGDAFEENLDELAPIAAELGQLGVKAFMFHERNVNADNVEKVEHAFREIARLSGGAYCKFDAGAARQLAELLRAVAAFSVGGVKALETKPGAVKLLTQLKKD